MTTPTELESRFIWLTAFFRSYHSFFAISSVCETLDEPFGDLWPFRHLNNVLVYDTVISWCKIFGVDSEECHWKRVVTDHDAFRIFLLNRIGKTKPEFAAYQKTILVFRNKWVVHYDPNYEHDAVPLLDLAHESALALHTYLRQHPHEGIPYAGPVSMVKFGKDVARALVSQLRLPRKTHSEI